MKTSSVPDRPRCQGQERPTFGPMSGPQLLCHSATSSANIPVAVGLSLHTVAPHRGHVGRGLRPSESGHLASSTPPDRQDAERSCGYSSSGGGHGRGLGHPRCR